MFREMGSISDSQQDALFEPTLSWIQQELAEELYLGWLAESRGQIVAGAGIHLRLFPPGPSCMKIGKWGHIVNVYTEPNHRRRGIARKLMHELLKWCSTQSLDHITLTASDQGHALYDALGFIPTADMSLPLHRLKNLDQMSNH